VSGPTPEHWLDVRGARIHNLRDVDLRLPHGLLVAFTGRSGSGKSSLAVDTIMAEAHRRSVQSMTAYARQFSARFAKPPVDSITGLCSAILLDQDQVNRNPRSTLGTSTDIFDLLRVLFARFGRPACPVCERPMTEPDGSRPHCPRHPDQWADRLDPKDFSFNLPFGACPSCDGLGSRLEPDPALAVGQPSRSVRDGAITAFRADRFTEVHQAVAVALCEQQGIDPDAPWSTLDRQAQDLLLRAEAVPVEMRPDGGKPWQTSYQGALPWLRQLYLSADSDAARNRIGEFLVESVCAECGGSRLGAAARGYRLAGHGLAALCADSLVDCRAAVAGLATTIAGAEPVLTEIVDRLDMLIELGLGYLSLDRSAPSLSGGEGQRARLATQVGTGLFGLMYVLDEPSAGLHPQDTERVIQALRSLQEQGNTVLVVEHDRRMILASDWLVDVGPGAGRDGGRVLYNGPTAEVGTSAESVTGPYLAAAPDAPARAPAEDRGSLRITGARAHNLAGIDVEIPLRHRVAITGVSGAGKSSLVRDVLLPALRSAGVPVSPPLSGASAGGSWQSLQVTGELGRVVTVDQAPIGRTPRSNPATYSGVFDGIRKVFAALPAARSAGLTAKHFSFNLPDGRCPTCAGEGEIRMQLQFLPDAVLGCEDCQGRRYQQRVLDVRRDGLSIADVLDLSVAEARSAFDKVPAIRRVLNTLAEIGLGYLRLGQPAPSLSGGEAQRLKLASELYQAPAPGTLYLLDEPTTGLHMADVAQLAVTLDRLVSDGHSVVVIEHDPELIASSDWVIDLGPGGGRHGGTVVAAGPPEAIRSCPASVTGRFL